MGEFPGQLQVTAKPEAQDNECFHVVLEDTGDVLYTTGTHTEGRGVSLRSQLEGMKVSQLKKRARGIFGVTAAELEAASGAEDRNERKVALVDLVLEKDKAPQTVSYPTEKESLMMISKIGTWLHEQAK